MKIKSDKPTQSIPCDCGNPNASWHGDRYGRRVYACDSCYTLMRKNRSQKRDKFGRLLWLVIMKSGKRHYASGNLEEIRKQENDDEFAEFISDDELDKVSQIRKVME